MGLLGLELLGRRLRKAFMWYSELQRSECRRPAELQLGQHMLHWLERDRHQPQEGWLQTGLPYTTCPTWCLGLDAKFGGAAATQHGVSMLTAGAAVL